jgi:UDP-glucose 4-epimerase
VVYGKEPDYLPQDESHPIRPTCPYAAAKLSVEKYMYYYHIEHGVDCTALRYANVYGPRQNPHGEAGVIAIFAEKMLNGEQPVIYGDGDQTRDFIYVGDVVASNRAALTKNGYGVYNIGTGVETSINDIFGHLKQLTGSECEQQHAPGKPGEQRRNALGSNKAKEELNWSADTDISDGLKQTVDWYKSQ